MRILHIDYSHVSNASKTVMPKHNNCYSRLLLANTKDKLTIKLTTTIIIEEIVIREENHKVPNGLPIKRNPQVGSRPTYHTCFDKLHTNYNIIFSVCSNQVY